MRNRCLPTLLILLAGASLAAGARSENRISIWPVDPLVKVFPDTPAESTTQPVLIMGGRNEYVSAQVAVRAGEIVRGLTIRWERPARWRNTYPSRPWRYYTLGEQATATFDALPTESLRARFVGFIPITKNTPNTPEDILVRKAPCEIPDPLLETAQIDLPANRTQPIWITVFIPEKATPGDYLGSLVVGNRETSAAISVGLEVFPFVLPTERHVWVTNWFNADRFARAHKVAPWSDAHWALLERYGRNMAEHRQNVVLTPLSLVRAIQEPDGRLAFDYERFDRWVQLFEKAGACGRIEIGHVAHFKEGGWDSREIALSDVRAVDRATSKPVTLPPDKALAPLLADLQRHLEERGWLAKSMIHVADEPAIHNIESWKKASDFVHRAAPKLKRIDAIESRDFDGFLEVWVPKLNFFPGWMNDYRKAQAKGNELWFYTCLHPQGFYPNRFLDYPLVGTRLLHWLSWEYNFDGYLHWGWNAWPADPFGALGDRLPPGDSHIVYPGADGPLDSVRWEMMREGLQDYEELRLLTEKTRQALKRFGKAGAALDPRQRSDEIARMMVRSFTDYERDPRAFRKAREALLTEIVLSDLPPVAVIATAPPAETEIVPGPIAIELVGFVEPGAEVTVAGQKVEVASDGHFGLRVSPARNGEIIIKVNRDNREKLYSRHFNVKSK